MSVELLSWVSWELDSVRLEFGTMSGFMGGRDLIVVGEWQRLEGLVTEHPNFLLIKVISL